MKILGVLATTAISAVFSCYAPACADVFTLSDALVVAYESNSQLAAERANVTASDEDVARARSGLRPRINAAGNYGLADTREKKNTTLTYPLSGDVSVTQDVLPIATFAEIERAKAQVRAERGRLVGTEQNVLIASVTAYVDVVRDTKRVGISQTNVDVLRQTRENVAKMFAAGAVTKTDLQQADARLAQAKINLYQARAALEASRANFEHVIGRPAGTLDDKPTLPKLPASIDAAMSDANVRNPEILVAINEERAASEAVASATSALLPRVSVSGQYQYSRDYQSIGNYQFQAPKNEMTVLGQVTVPLYQGGAEYAGMRQAKNLLARASHNTADARKHVEESVRSSWAAYQAAAESIDASLAQVAADEQAVEGVRIEQKGGERSILDVLNAQQELLTAQTMAINAKHDWIIAAYRLLASTGGATARQLGLPVKLYDPTVYYRDNSWKWIGIGD